jgi:AcrR family transcriptional regulator
MPKTLKEAEIEEFRDDLCAAAARIFAEKGPEGFSMRELAASAGVSPMTPYRYFRNKEDILAAVRTRAFLRFAETLEAAFALDGDALAKSRAVGRAYVRFAFEEPYSYRLMFDLSQPDETSYPALVEAAERARATMTQHVIPLIDKGILSGDPTRIGHVMWASLHGAVVLALAGKLSPLCGFETIVEESFTALMRGFAVRPGPG